MPSLRILVADDHNLVRRGIKALLEERPEWRICGEATTGTEAVAKAEDLRPDVVILDINMPDLDGLEAGRRIRKALPNTEVLIISMHFSDQLTRQIVDAGIGGYVVKSDSVRDLIEAVETLARHEPFFTSCATKVILSKFIAGGSSTEVPVSVPERITAREREIIKFVVNGMSSKEIASHLGISVKTCETHRANIMRKLDIHNASELVRYAVRNRLIDA